MSFMFKNITAQVPTLDADKVRAAIMSWPNWPQHYETGGGRRFYGMPVALIPDLLAACGWESVQHLGERGLAKMGLTIVSARYVGSAHPNNFFRAVVGREDRTFETDSRPGGLCPIS
jgi:hypothetical protein